MTFAFGVCLVITWNNPKRLEKPEKSPKKDLLPGNRLRVGILSMVTIGAYDGPRHSIFLGRTSDSKRSWWRECAWTVTSRRRWPRWKFPPTAAKGLYLILVNSGKNNENQIIWTKSWGIFFGHDLFSWMENRCAENLNVVNLFASKEYIQECRDLGLSARLLRLTPLWNIQNIAWWNIEDLTSFQCLVSIM